MIYDTMIGRRSTRLFERPSSGATRSRWEEPIDEKTPSG